MVTGLRWSLLIPKLPAAPDAHSSKVGLRGVGQALVKHPIIMLAGFVGGFFESGITSILPLYGLALGLGAAAAALLVSASGLGSALMMLPAGMLADRWTHKAADRRTMMVVLSFTTLVATCVIPFVAHIGWLAWPIVFVWGDAGGSLYTLAMLEPVGLMVGLDHQPDRLPGIGAREKGITLVNSTVVLVLTYTLGSISVLQNFFQCFLSRVLAVSAIVLAFRAVATAAVVRRHCTKALSAKVASRSLRYFASKTVNSTAIPVTNNTLAIRTAIGSVTAAAHSSPAVATPSPALHATGSQAAAAGARRLARRGWQRVARTHALLCRQRLLRSRCPGRAGAFRVGGIRASLSPRRRARTGTGQTARRAR